MARLSKVFTYGTLRDKKQPTHRLPGYMMFKVVGKTSNFPFIQAYPWDDRQPEIYGNILEVTDDQLEKLDQYEYIKNGLYVRQKVAVYEMKTPAEPEIMWAYIGGPALTSTPIPSGDWEIQ